MTRQIGIPLRDRCVTGPRAVTYSQTMAEVDSHIEKEVSDMLVIWIRRAQVRRISLITASVKKEVRREAEKHRKAGEAESH